MFRTLVDVKKRGVGGTQKVKGKGSVSPMKFKTKGKAGTYKGTVEGHE